MAERPVRPYPSVGDPARFDEIVRRGTSMRRRRRLAAGAGAGGAVAVVALGVLLVTGSGGDTEGIVADRDDVAPVEETTTTAPVPPAEMTVSVEVTDDAVNATVVDPAQPEVDDAKQCVVVVATAAGARVATGYACNEMPGDGPSTDVPLDPVSPELEISPCAPQIERIDPEAPVPTGSRPATTNFRIDLGALAGDVDEIAVEAVSGRGDGCPGTSSESTEIENLATVSVEMS